MTLSNFERGGNCYASTITKLREALEAKGATFVAGGLVDATGRVGVLVELRSETDFVARNDEFKRLAHEIALQVAAMNPKDVKTLLASEYIRDATVTIADLVKQTIAKVGENITVGRFSRIALGE